MSNILCLLAIIAKVSIMQGLSSIVFSFVKSSLRYPRNTIEKVLNSAFYLLDGSSSSWSFRLRRKSATRYRSNRFHVTIKVN